MTRFARKTKRKKPRQRSYRERERVRCTPGPLSFFRLACMEDPLGPSVKARLETWLFSQQFFPPLILEVSSWSPSELCSKGRRGSDPGSSRVKGKCDVAAWNRHTDSPNQAPRSYGSGRYGFGVSGAQEDDCVLRDRCSAGTRHAFSWSLFSKHLTIVLGLTELCHEVRNPGPRKPKSSATKTTISTRECKKKSECEGVESQKCWKNRQLKRVWEVGATSSWP